LVDLKYKLEFYIPQVSIKTKNGIKSSRITGMREAYIYHKQC